MARKKTAATKKKQAGKLHTSANRKYKDTVFRMLFADKSNLLSLYNAMSGSDYHDPSKLQIITLENAIYIGMKNDLAFVIDTNLFLYEHQSTYNPNMPLRNLFYISSEYQKMVDSNKLYSSTLLEIPAPHFVVFYNGTTKQEDSWYNYLSDSYHNFSGIPDLELKVVTLNINKGHNKELMEQCQTLNEYAQYVEKVRTYTKEEIGNILKTLEEDGSYGNILRAKGMVAGADGEWIYFDMVPGEHEVRTGAPEYTGRICVIGANLNEDKLKELFHV